MWDIIKTRSKRSRSGSRYGLTSAQFYSTDSYLAGDLERIVLSYNDLTGWDFTGSNLKNASFSGSALTDAKFENADIRQANFAKSDSNASGTGLTSTQIYSTDSYRSGDLTGISLYLNDLTGWDLSGKNLTNVDLGYATLADTNFTGATIQGVRFNATTHRGFTAEQLYSTESYQNGNLVGIDMKLNDMSGWDLAGQDLTRAYLFGGKLIYTNLENANLTGANFSLATLAGANLKSARLVDARLDGAKLDDADLSGANLVGTIFDQPLHYPDASLVKTRLNGADARAMAPVDTSMATTHNFIYPDGHIEGLHIEASETMRLWDFDPEFIPRYKSEPIGDIPIVVTQAMSSHTDGTLRIVFEDDQWGSTVHFESAIPVELAGTLELLFDGHVAPRRLIGTTFQLFDWTGVDPHGEFATIVADPRATWDTSALYTTGEVTLVSAVPEPAGVFLAWVAIGLAAWVVQARQVGVRITPLNSGGDLI